MELRTQIPLWRRLVRRAGRRLLDLAENNGVWDVTHNGELWLASTLLSSFAAAGLRRPFVVVDGGANAGDYTCAVLRAARNRGCAVTVHAMEPSPHAAAQLRSRFEGDSSVRIVQAAVGNRSGTAILHAGDTGSTLASLVSREVLAGATGVEVPVLRLEDYLRSESVDAIDLLKLDVEGFELAALDGLGSRLRPDVVRVIQFEYGGATLDANGTLRDLYRRLSDSGYMVGKLFPRAVEVRAYSPGMEHFTYSNFVAMGHGGSPE